jgi:hypothetical protein
MKRKSFALVIVLNLLFAGMIMAQDCQSWYPLKKGTVTEMTNYNAKNAVTGSARTTVISNETSGNGYVVTVKSEEFDAKGTSTGSGEFTYACKGGTFSVDMKSFFDPSTMSAYQNMDVKINASDMEMPSTLTIGQSLKDATLTMNVTSQGFPVMNINIRMFNRKVAAMESVTTTAGTFDCIKITYDVETKSMFNITTKGIDWYAKETGSVKTETYDQNGKLQTYSLLTKITR